MNRNLFFLIQGPNRSIYFESFALELRRRGFNVTIASICQPGPIQAYFREQGFNCIEHEVSRSPLPLYYLKHAFFWKKKMKEHQATVIFSHLQWANFIALLTALLSLRKIEVIATRHHVDASFLFQSRKRITEDAAVNLLSQKQAVVSQKAKDFMLSNEKFAKVSKIHFIPLGYDFELYRGLEENKSEEIRTSSGGSFVLLTAARMVKTKKHDLVLDAMKLLIDKNIPVRLLLLDDGPDKERLQEKTKLLGLNDHVQFHGNRKNIPDYIRACDLIVHPSIEESSNQVVKEGAIYGKTSIVTQGIGDFDEYLENNGNAFLIPQTATAKELADLIEQIYNGKYNLGEMAEKLRNIVNLKFNIKNTVDQYIRLLELK